MKPMPADADISSGRVLRAFARQDKRFEQNQHLMVDEVVSIPIAERRALVEGGYLQIYAHQRQTPPWNPRDEHERAALRPWFVEQLDARDIEQIDRDQASFVKWLTTLPSRREAEKRASEAEKRGAKWPQPVEFNQLQAIRQMRAAADKAQWEAGDPGPLRRHYPELEGIIPDEPPRSRGQRHAQAQQERGDRQRRKAQAADDVRYLDGLWNHRGRWNGKQGARQLAIEVAADRHGLIVLEVEDAIRRGESVSR